MRRWKFVIFTVSLLLSGCGAGDGEFSGERTGRAFDNALAGTVTTDSCGVRERSGDSGEGKQSSR